MDETENDAKVDKRNVVCTSVGKSLKSLRIATGMSQADLAFHAEVDRTFVSQIERGVGNPSILTLANLCHGLGITLADLFEPVRVALPPQGQVARRANSAKPTAKIPKSRLR